jgi:hypothetical protein
MGALQTPMDLEIRSDNWLKLQNYFGIGIFLTHGSEE